MHFTRRVISELLGLGTEFLDCNLEKNINLQIMLHAMMEQYEKVHEFQVLRMRTVRLINMIY